jgi:hypothetical protein
MLRILAAHSQNINWKRPNLPDDVRLLLAEVGKLEDLRNDAIHSPLFFAPNSIYGSKGEKVVPASWLLNPRASSLAKRADLLSAFRYCRNAAIILSDFAREMDFALVNQGKPWPDRPRLPNRGAGQDIRQSQLKRQRLPPPSQA